MHKTSRRRHQVPSAPTYRSVAEPIVREIFQEQLALLESTHSLFLSKSEIQQLYDVSTNAVFVDIDVKINQTLFPKEKLSKIVEYVHSELSRHTPIRHKVRTELQCLMPTISSKLAKKIQLFLKETKLRMQSERKAPTNRIKTPPKVQSSRQTRIQPKKSTCSKPLKQWCVRALSTTTSTLVKPPKPQASPQKPSENEKSAVYTELPPKEQQGRIRALKGKPQLGRRLF